MAFSDQFVCPEVRFKFWNGRKTYTVEYMPSTRTWYIFDEHTQSDRLAMFEIPKKSKALCDIQTACDYLNKYFDEKSGTCYASVY